MVDQGEVELVASLRQGDEAAFLALVQKSHPSMVRVARVFVTSEAVAEEVVATLVGSIGLIASMPITTALAALLALRLRGRALEAEHAHAHPH